MLKSTTLLTYPSLIIKSSQTSTARHRRIVFSPLLHLTLAVLTSFVLLFLAFGTKLCGLLLLSTNASLLFDLIVPLTACVLAVCVSSLSNPMHALLSLVGVFLATILFYVKSGIEFIGLVTLIVYVGAVAILFLFVIMLLNVKSLTTTSVLLRYRLQYVALAFGLGLAVYLLVNLIYPLSIASSGIIASDVRLSSSGYFFADAYYAVLYRAADVNAIAGLYTTHAVLFWITTTNLLLALLGSIILAISTTEQPRAVRSTVLPA